MCDGMMFVIGKDGVAREYDDTYDVTIHCKSEKEQQKVIEDLESRRWIPCSERLPEEEYVLISKKPTTLSGSKWCVTIAIRMADPRSGKIHWRDIGFGVIQDNEVLAWKPLPKPYREDEE